MTNRQVWVKATLTDDDGGDYVRIVVDGMGGPEAVWMDSINVRSDEPKAATPPAPPVTEKKPLKEGDTVMVEGVIESLLGVTSGYVLFKGGNCGSYLTTAELAQVTLVEQPSMVEAEPPYTLQDATVAPNVDAAEPRTRSVDVMAVVEAMGMEPGLLHYDLHDKLGGLEVFLRCAGADHQAQIAAVASTVTAWRIAHPKERYYGE